MQGVADRVLLGLIPSSRIGWQAAIRALKPSGGIIHLHENLSDSREAADVTSIMDALAAEAEAIGRPGLFRVLRLERVKWYAPHIRHAVLDIECLPAASQSGLSPSPGLTEIHRPGSDFSNHNGAAHENADPLKGPASDSERQVANGGASPPGGPPGVWHREPGPPDQSGAVHALVDCPQSAASEAKHDPKHGPGFDQRPSGNAAAPVHDPDIDNGQADHPALAGGSPSTAQMSERHGDDSSQLSDGEHQPCVTSSPIPLLNQAPTSQPVTPSADSQSAWDCTTANNDATHSQLPVSHERIISRNSSQGRAFPNPALSPSSKPDLNGAAKPAENGIQPNGNGLSPNPALESISNSKAQGPSEKGASPEGPSFENTGGVAVLHGVDTEHFREVVVPAQKPAILRGMDLGPAPECWTPEYLQSCASATQIVSAHVSTEPHGTAALNDPRGRSSRLTAESCTVSSSDS